jgi:hypothetical protein
MVCFDNENGKFSILDSILILEPNNLNVTRKFLILDTIPTRSKYFERVNPLNSGKSIYFISKELNLDLNKNNAQ